MSELSRQRPRDMSLQDMERYVKTMVEDTLEKPKIIDRKQWLETYDPRGQARDEMKRLKKLVKSGKEVHLLTRKGDKVEVSGHFHTQCGLTSGKPRNVKHHVNMANCLYERVEKVTSKVNSFGIVLGGVYTMSVIKPEQTGRSACPGRGI